MDELIDAILRLGSASLATEEAACDALAAMRFPDGITCRCGLPCARDGAHATCPRGHRCTILVDTPFASKTAPRLRALFLAIRAFSLSPRSISARELARDVDMPVTTLWRHLLTLRALMPPPNPRPTIDAAPVQVSGRHSRAAPAWVRGGACTEIAATRELPEVVANVERMTAESVRTVVNGTFHGVSARWLAAYVDEARLRWRLPNRCTVELLVERLVRIARPVTFHDVRHHFAALR